MNNLLMFYRGTANRSIQAGFEAPSLITPIKSGLLNINGVLYKSTPNKLQKSHLNVTRGRPSPTADRVVIIRGEKFHLDGTGKRLRKTGNTPEKGSSIKRIDIGGLTYVAKGSHGTLERTNFHIVRNHLTYKMTQIFPQLFKILTFYFISVKPNRKASQF